MKSSDLLQKANNAPESFSDPNAGYGYEPQLDPNGYDNAEGNQIVNPEGENTEPAPESSENNDQI